MTSERIKKLFCQLECILKQVLDIHKKVSDISLVTPEEYQKLVYTKMIKNFWYLNITRKLPVKS